MAQIPQVDQRHQKNRQKIVDFVQQGGIFVILSTDEIFLSLFKSMLLRHLDVPLNSAIFFNNLGMGFKVIEKLPDKKMVIIIDRALHGIKGRELLKLTKDKDNLFSIVLTDEVPESVLLLFVEQGVNNIMIKPLSIDTLIDKISTTITPGQAGQYIDAAKKKLREKKYSEAIQICRNFLEKRPDSASAYMIMGEALYYMGQKEEALSCLYQAEQYAAKYKFLDPTKKLAEIFKQDGQIDRQLECLEKLDYLSPWNSDRKIEMGDINLQLGKDEKAEVLFDTAVKTAKKEAKDLVNEARRNIADVCMNNKPEIAEKYLREIVESKSSYLSSDASLLEVLNTLGMTLRKQGKFDESINEYRKAIEAFPNDPALQYNIALSLSEAKRHDEAVRFMEKAIELEPQAFLENEVLRYNIGVIYMHAGRLDKALAHFQKAFELNDSFDDAIRMIKVLKQKLAK